MVCKCSRRRQRICSGSIDVVSLFFVFRVMCFSHNKERISKHCSSRTCLPPGPGPVPVLSWPVPGAQTIPVWPRRESRTNLACLSQLHSTEPRVKFPRNSCTSVTGYTVSSDRNSLFPFQSASSRKGPVCGILNKQRHIVGRLSIQRWVGELDERMRDLERRYTDARHLLSCCLHPIQY